MMTSMSQTNGTESQWFDSERFLDPNFNAEQYVADLRRYVPLESLSSELDAYLAVLRNRLLEVINEHYADFVSLSSRLVNVDTAVLRMQKPLLEIKDKLLGVRNNVSGALDYLRDGLNRRQDVASVRALLEVMQDAAHVMAKVEKLLAEISTMEGSSARGRPESAGGSPLEARVRIFERLASEVARLNFYTARGKELHFVQQLEHRVKAGAGKLQELLSEGLAQALKEGNPSAQIHCLQAFAAIGDASGAEQILRQVVVAPLVSDSLSAANEKASAPLASTSSSSFPQVLETLATIIERDIGAFMHDVDRVQVGLHIFDFLGNSVLAEIDIQLAKAMPGAFSVGVPERFAANYKASQRFVERLEALSSTARALDAFRGSMAYQSWLDRWKLSVYYGLCFQNVASALENGLSSKELTASATSAETSLGLTLQPTIALYRGLRRCLAQEVWVQPLAGRFLRIVLQLLSRFSCWLSRGLEARAAAPALGDEEATGSADRWAIGIGPDQLCSLRADTEIFLSWLESEYSTQLVNMLPFSSKESQDSVRGAVRSAGLSVRQQADSVTDSIVADLVQQCSQVLKQLQGIMVTYRMTSKPKPTKASHYVNGILKSLGALLATEAASRLSGATRGAIAQGVVTGVTQQYVTQVRDQLQAMRTAELSLQKVRKNRAAETSADGAKPLSDVDKVNAQLFLDAQDYGTHISKFGVDPQHIPAYTELWNLVAPIDQQQEVAKK